MQSKLDDTVWYSRSTADGAKAGGTLAAGRRVVPACRIRIGLGKFRMIEEIKEISRENQPCLLSHRNPHILLQREVEIVDAWVANTGKIARRVPERLVDIGGPGQIHQSGSGAGTGKIESLIVKPEIGCTRRAGDRAGITNHDRTILQEASAVAEPVRVVSDAKGGTRANGVNGAHSPPTEYFANWAAVQPWFAMPERELHNWSHREP